MVFQDWISRVCNCIWGNQKAPFSIATTPKLHDIKYSYPIEITFKQIYLMHWLDTSKSSISGNLLTNTQGIIIFARFYGISTLVGYLMPNPILDIYDLVWLGFMAYQPLQVIQCQVLFVHICLIWRKIEKTN